MVEEQASRFLLRETRHDGLQRRSVVVITGSPQRLEEDQIRCCESPCEVLTLDPMLGEYLSYLFSVAGED